LIDNNEAKEPNFHLNIMIAFNPGTLDSKPTTIKEIISLKNIFNFTDITNFYKKNKEINSN
jgi:hypothetical protein